MLRWGSVCVEDGLTDFSLCVRGRSGPDDDECRMGYITNDTI